MAFTASRLFFSESGAKDAPGMVFLHGGGCGGWMWRKQEATFHERYHVLIPDLPESGKSSECGPFSHARAADLVAELIQERCEGSAVVIGLSEGAQVTVEMLARTPELVHKAMISSAILRPIPGAWMITPGMFGWSYRLFMAPFRHWDWWIRLNMKYSAGLSEEYFNEFKEIFQTTTETGFVHMMGAVQYRMPNGLDKSGAECLVVAGSKEYKQMIDSARDLVKTLPHARGALVSLGSQARLAEEHNWAITAPDLFNRTLEAWLNQKDLPQELWPL